jgi:hypothetical protein
LRKSHFFLGNRKIFVDKGKRKCDIIGLMKPLNIMHHELDLSYAGGDNCTLDMIRKVPTPQIPDDQIVELEDGSQKVIRSRWHPIAHSLLVDRFKEHVEKTENLEIVQEYYTLARKGQRFFALFQVDGIKSPHSDEVGTVVGLRNSHDKSFAAAVCAGCAPFVCTNLAFSNEVVLNRRHTTNIMDALPMVISRAIGNLTERWAENDKRIDAYKAFQLDNEQADHLAVELFLSGAITKTHIGEVAKQWRNPDHDEFAERNAWSFYNGVTNILRGNLSALNCRSDALHGLLDVRFGVHKAVA